MSRTRTPRHLSDPLWYRATYNTAATALHLYSMRHQELAASYPEAPSVDDLRVHAQQRATELVWASVTALEKGVEDRETRSFLELVEAAGLILLAGVLQATDLRSARWGSPPHDKSLPLPAVRTRRDLLEALAGNGVTERDLITLVTDHRSYVGGADRLPYRARYNLACYYTRVHDYEQALRELAAAVEGGDILEWAKKDPSLEDLRERRRREWDDIIAKAPVAPESKADDDDDDDSIRAALRRLLGLD